MRIKYWKFSIIFIVYLNFLSFYFSFSTKNYHLISMRNLLFIHEMLILCINFYLLFKLIKKKTEIFSTIIILPLTLGVYLLFLKNQSSDYLNLYLLNIIASLFFLCLSLILTINIWIGGFFTVGNEGLIIEIRKYIDNNYNKPLNLGKLSKEFKINNNKLTFLFYQKYSLTINNYILKLRIDHAKDLLIKTDYSITEIALKTGFNSNSYFNKQFKKIMKITANEYRKINN